ncbi:hypothetical protein [Psychrobacillus vulpis]|uniref:Uncharacterized protein n=1 Tax=Psychrobacillus vulpis TaxID=2325572 RepID=A0A544TR72_9BACI|nr:hypothetical protein [Psychrobacillus vulpis]TQR19923.1 hypothetical protein FG384_09675 [Psychrobacillus vulpis]
MIRKGSRPLNYLPSSSSIEWSKYKQKNYLHFDERIKIEHMKSKLQDSEWVTSYAFLTFIKSDYTYNRA